MKEVNRWVFIIAGNWHQTLAIAFTTRTSGFGASFPSNTQNLNARAPRGWCYNPSQFWFTKQNSKPESLVFR